MAEFKLPDVGEGLTEAEIVSWKVKEGDTVEINDIIVEIETAKSLVELPSPYAGTVQALLVAEGEMIPVGTPIIAIGDPSEAPAPAAAAPAPGRDGDRPVQPRRQRWRRGREPGRPQQGRPRSAASRPSRRGDAGDRCRHRLPDPAAGRVRARRRPVRGRRAGRREAGAGDLGPHRARPARDGDGAGRGDRARRGPRAGQAAGAQAGQGPRRRHRAAPAHRPERHGVPRGRPGRRWWPGCPGRRDGRAVTCPRASARPASRSRASAR